MLQDAVARADVVIVVIGKNWLDVKDAAGGRRLDDEHDFVRIEIETALAQGIPVIPVLVSGATMVAEADLPASLQQLAYRNGIPVRPDPDFHRDIDRLAAALERLAPPVAEPIAAKKRLKSETPGPSSANVAHEVDIATMIANELVEPVILRMIIIGVVRITLMPFADQSCRIASLLEQLCESRF